ncbi:MAG: hypothetical protein ABI704_11955 [Kofleriaceae bacterium]
MAEKTEKEKQRDTDFDELGSVDNVNDLAPESGVGPTRRAKAQHRILQPNAAGFFETEAGAAGGLGAPLSIGAPLKKDGGPILQKYEEGYNAYAQPLRSTLRAMGRLKDVSLTGAPLTPAELMKRPELAARFGHLGAQASTVDVSSVQKDQAFDAWSDQANKMKLHVQMFGAGQHELAGVIANYRRVQLRLKQHSVERERASKTKEKREIDNAAETLAKIVDVSSEALSGMGEVEALLASHAALSKSGPDSLAGLPQSNNPDWAQGTTNDPTGAKRSSKSAAQHVSSGVAKLGRGVQVIEKEVEKTHTFGLSAKDVFTVLIGAKRYHDLETDIDSLDKQISKLGFEEEAQDVRSANEGLCGFVVEIAVRRDEVRGDRIAARRDARTFAHAHGGGDSAVTAMYAAEAYQELAALGELTEKQRKGMVDSSWRRVSAYLHGNDFHRYAAIGALDDARLLDSNLRAVAEQREMFATQLPQWQRVSTQWSEFLGPKNDPLVPEANEADKRSGSL